jgi:hypothetical protein
MEHMMKVQLIDVLPGNDIDPGIPFGIEGGQQIYLIALSGRKIREIFKDKICHKKNVRKSVGYSGLSKIYQ